MCRRLALSYLIKSGMHWTMHYALDILAWKIKKYTKSYVTGEVNGDFDHVVMKECMVELSHPVACIYRDAVNTHCWPTKWKLEKQIMINMCPNPT